MIIDSEYWSKEHICRIIYNNEIYLRSLKTDMNGTTIDWCKFNYNTDACEFFDKKFDDKLEKYYQRIIKLNKINKNEK